MSLTRQERVLYFDEYVESVDTALRDPQVSSKLGALATRIIAANARAFLPNERDGQMHVPGEHRGSDTIAIVPTSMEEAYRSTHLVQPIYAEHGQWKKMGNRVTSSISGVTVNTDAMMHWLENDSNEAKDPSHRSPKGLKVTSGAYTSVAFTTGSDDTGGRYYAASHPVIVVKADLVKGLNHWNQAATVGHEELHGLDIIDNPILYKMPIGAAGSELAAYYVSATLYDRTSQPAASEVFTRKVEQWRKEHMPLNVPFAPNNEQLGTLRGWVVE